MEPEIVRKSDESESNFESAQSRKYEPLFSLELIAPHFKDAVGSYRR